MPFNAYESLDLLALSKKVLDFWESESVFEKSLKIRQEAPPFVFYEGPPSANGMPGIHHVMGRTIKDIFCRYYTQKGYKVNRKAGWDTHGLPVELGVEKELNITKEDIGKKISVKEYNQACKKAVMKYTDVWNNLTKKIGYWLDMEKAYITYDSKYIESVWWLLHQIYKKGWIYKGYSVQPFSPKAGTGLSTHELNMPDCYKDVTDTTVVAQFKTKKASLPKRLTHYPNLYLLAWTTTPWTLPSNTALTVGNKIDYVVVRTINQYTFKKVALILAKALINKVFDNKFKKVEHQQDIEDYIPKKGKIPYLIDAECKGKDLVGITYEQLLPFAKPYKNAEDAFRVISGNFVTTDEGTGIVHTAPTFGADDAKAAMQAVPPVPPMLILDKQKNPIPLVDTQGKFISTMGFLSGKYVKNAYYKQGEAPEKSVDIEIAILLKEQNSAFKVEKYTHPYPHCWRTHKPVLYYPLDSWFIKITDFKDQLYELNKEINWKPKSTGEKRFGQWLKNADDWNLSRSRYWGIPLPIWRTDDGTEELFIHSTAHLKSEIEYSIDKGYMNDNLLLDFDVKDMSDNNYKKIDLHKHNLDQIILVSPSGKPMKREADLIDVWFDSGSMPFAQWHYPFEKPNYGNSQLEDVFPADFIAEGVDQTRGWFYTLHAISVSVFGKPAYKNVISNGLVLDKNSRKMSKSLGNSIDPFEMIDTYGADALRWYMVGNANPWENLKFDKEGIVEVTRKFYGTLFNIYSFFSLYANIDNYQHSNSKTPISQRPELDRWIISELNTLIAKVDAAYLDYEPTKVVRLISYFVQENLSNWYVRLSRRRFWKGEYQEDKIMAYHTLYCVLLEVSKLMAPISPFYAEVLYRDLIKESKLDNPISIHLSDFPKSKDALRDQKLERRMHLAQTIASLVLSIRKKNNLRVRQPLKRILIPILNDTELKEIQSVSEIIKSEVNVKNIEFVDKNNRIFEKEIKPNFKKLGPRFGKRIKAVSQAISNLTPQEIKDFEFYDALTIKIEEQEFELQKEEVEVFFKDPKGWAFANLGKITVALDISIDQNLKDEGIARELVNRIQNLRKTKKFEVTDNIDVIVSKNDDIERVIRKNINYLKDETLIQKLLFENKGEALTENISIENIEFTINLTKSKTNG